MRGAQQLLKQNRQKRLELMAKRRATQEKLLASAAELIKSVEKDHGSRAEGIQNHSPPMQSPTDASPSDPDLRSSKINRSSASSNNNYTSVSELYTLPVNNTSSSSNRDSHRKENDDGTDCTSLASNPSSLWTDDASHYEKNSRRALILQMAKNRMKGKSETSRNSHPSRRSARLREEAEKKVARIQEKEEEESLDIAQQIKGGRFSSSKSPTRQRIPAPVMDLD